jgi:hypothetical protein
MRRVSPSRQRQRRTLSMRFAGSRPPARVFERSGARRGTGPSAMMVGRTAIGSTSLKLGRRRLTQSSRTRFGLPRAWSKCYFAGSTTYPGISPISSVWIAGASARSRQLPHPANNAQPHDQNIDVREESILPRAGMRGNQSSVLIKRFRMQFGSRWHSLRIFSALPGRARSGVLVSTAAVPHVAVFCG